ncbi:exonuclease [Bacillus pseudomycoides]|uniref:exonuclease n=1 Tax=Bacillus pseudomycoides TaxID=64104 RepID=UPI000BECE168|nr:exonuclease [Bacillus pseudomycoides]PEE37107.1 exonuclease [Bacillus pseudomycoides]PGA91078.1 exonuclease [Bacillus pseudomycoides]PHF37477.1 exonuclease [Bacillus pseudomycoides]
MNELKYYIVFDVERNFRLYKLQDPLEVVDIGAIKVEASTMRIIGQFSSLVKPTAPLTRHTTKLTGITKQDLKEVEMFPEVMERFLQFAGDDYMFITWGKEDYKFLAQDCKLHHIECPNIENERKFDLQKFVFQAYDQLFIHTPSLKFAVEQFSLEWEGKQHRAFADAKNTLNIFLKVFKEKDIYKRYKRNEELVLVKNGLLTEKAKKKMKRWVFKELKKKEHSPFTWDDFQNSKTWGNITERYYIDNNTIRLLQNYFTMAVKKGEQQLRVLEEINKKINDA